MTPYEVATTLGERNGFRLELVGGIPVWELFPNVRHQRAVDRIRASIQPASRSETVCSCIHLADVYVRFPDGSLKRPDISIFCGEPEEQTTAITMLPEAVVEILSADYEAKDLAIGVPFYLRMGIKDILVLDPETLAVSHFRPAHSVATYTSPVALTLACGCTVTV
ncbi:MAG: Uma2 family endonuclease [Capsulimonadales bacterium]|nr:Uma2 family endonuclease [Capsulimonadales bacterium]